MQVIYKYPLAKKQSPEPQLVPGIPRGAEILSVGVQENELVLWVMFEDTGAKMPPLALRKILVVWTGHLFPKAEPMRFIGTVTTLSEDKRWEQMPLVWHVFDLGEQQP